MVGEENLLALAFSAPNTDAGAEEEKEEEEEEKAYAPQLPVVSSTRIGGGEPKPPSTETTPSARSSTSAPPRRAAAKDDLAGPGPGGVSLSGKPPRGLAVGEAWRLWLWIAVLPAVAARASPGASS